MYWRLDESVIGVAYGLDERVMVETDGLCYQGSD